ncbi:MAG: hypothetical protein IJJ52_02040 [Lachnospiraceae bacterium]|nr:hypothetical protein [Lachnospiraceae bacterium]
MTYFAFRETLIGDIKTMLCDGERLDIRKVTKNNGVSLTGLTIFAPGEYISPTFYAEQFYAAYQQGTTIHEIASAFVGEYKKYRNVLHGDEYLLRDYEKIKGGLRLRLINRSLNKELLRRIPGEEYLDLIFVPYVKMCFPGNQVSTALITEDQIREWGIEKERVFEDAFREMAEREEDVLLNMKDELEEQKGIFIPDQDETSLLYVLTNRSRMYGASVIIYSPKVRELSERLHSDLLLIPSSIHEWILAADPGEYREGFNKMVEEINRTCLDQGDVLSDHIYIYRRENGVIEY